jgi:hypothetical protein
MSQLGSVALVIAGALLYWRVDGSWVGVDAGTFGVILVVVGAIGVALFRPSWGAIGERTADHERPLPRR